jgi:hypothetical protein
MIHDGSSIPAVGGDTHGANPDGCGPSSCFQQRPDATLKKCLPHTNDAENGARTRQNTHDWFGMQGKCEVCGGGFRMLLERASPRIPIVHIRIYMGALLKTASYVFCSGGDFGSYFTHDLVF